MPRLAELELTEPRGPWMQSPLWSAVVLLGVAVAIQVTLMPMISIGDLHATPDLVIVTVCAVGMYRGVVVGAVGGFFAGLALELMLPGNTLGVVALAGVAIGAWCGRYAMTSDEPTWWLFLLVSTIASGLVPFWVGIVQLLRGTGPGIPDIVADLAGPQMVFAPPLAALVWWVARRLLGSRQVIEPGMMSG